MIGWRKSSLLRQPITLPDSCFRFASREQIRLVENGLKYKTTVTPKIHILIIKMFIFGVTVVLYFVKILSGSRNFWNRGLPLASTTLMYFKANKSETAQDSLFGIYSSLVCQMQDGWLFLMSILTIYNLTNLQIEHLLARNTDEG